MVSWQIRTSVEQFNGIITWPCFREIFPSINVFRCGDDMHSGFTLSLVSLFEEVSSESQSSSAVVLFSAEKKVLISKSVFSTLDIWPNRFCTFSNQIAINLKLETVNTECN